MSGRRLILIGYGEALAAPEVAWSLRGAGFDVHVFARSRRRLALRADRRLTLHEIPGPGESTREARAALEALVARLNPAAVMPLDDGSVWLCSRTNLAGSEIIGPRGVEVEVALNKELQFRAAERAGLHVPAWVLVGDGDDPPEDVTQPCIVKPALAAFEKDGRLTRGGAAFATCDSELREAIDRCRGQGPLLVQQVIRGVGRGVFGIGLGGRVIALSGHERVRMMNPAGSGSSACISVEPEAGWWEAAPRFVEEARWDGLFMIELIRDADGREWFIELNGRPWGSMALSRRSGLEYPARAARMKTDAGFSVPEVSPRVGVLCRHLGRELIHAMFVLRGPKGPRPPAWPSRLDTACSLLSPSGLRAGWYNFDHNARRVFFEDTWRTVWAQVSQ